MSETEEIIQQINKPHVIRTHSTSINSTIYKFLPAKPKDIIIEKMFDDKKYHDRKKITYVTGDYCFLGGSMNLNLK